MKIDFAFTYCCDGLQSAISSREWWFQIDTILGKVSLTDINDSITRPTCPFCDRHMEDIIDIDIEGMVNNTTL